MYNGKSLTNTWFLLYFCMLMNWLNMFLVCVKVPLSDLLVNKTENSFSKEEEYMSSLHFALNQCVFLH